MTELNPLIKAFVKTLEEANIITTSDLTGTQFECQLIVMDSLDIEPGTVVYVGAWEAMRIVGNGSRGELVWVGFDGHMYTHEEFADTVCSTQGVVRVVHYGII